MRSKGRIDILKPSSNDGTVIDGCEKLSIYRENNGSHNGLSVTHGAGVVAKVWDSENDGPGSGLNADLLEKIQYQPKNKLQGWTSDEEFVWEHWYNIYVHNQGGDYVFDNENYFSCVYILNNTTDFLFNETFLDELRMYFGGNGEEFESLRIGDDVICDVIIMNDL